MTDEMTISHASDVDAPEILALTRRAFAAAAELYDDPDLPPLVETLDEHRARYGTFVVLKATDADGVIAGSVQGRLADDGSCYVARLAVDPGRQGSGIGRALTLALEAEFPTARRFELFTGHLNTASLGLYASLGYAETRREPVDDRLTLVWLEKTLPGA
jgi:ribosomal protein S18 acetylase RimI-like enzyme